MQEKRFGLEGAIIPMELVKDLTENSVLIGKGCKNNALRMAIEFYSEEVVDDKRPLYGIYKALEVLIKELKERYLGKGREKLGKITGKSKKFVVDILESAQLQRHAVTSAWELLTEEECIRRTKIIIQAYADFI